MSRFDKLVARVLKEEPDLTPAGVVEYLNEVGYDTAFYLADPEGVTAFRHLRQDARLKAAEGYFGRHPERKPSGRHLGKYDRMLDHVKVTDHSVAEVVARIQEEGVDVPSAVRGLVAKFRKLRKADRAKVVLEYMKRKGPARAAEQETRKADRATLAEVFLLDWAYPSCSIYDVGPFAWVASKQEGELVWEVASPDQLRIHLTFPFQSLSEVMGALLRLAVAQKRAFEVEVPQRAPRNMFDVVLMPVGDRRAAPYAFTPEGALEIEGVPPNTALLFQKGPEPGVGRLSIFEQGPGKDPMYGLTVWSPFYALEFSTPGFERRPRIIVGV